MDTVKKRPGQFSDPNNNLISDCLAKDYTNEQIVDCFNEQFTDEHSRTKAAILSNIKKLRIKAGLANNIDDTQDLRIKLKSREYYKDVTRQFTEDEMEYFEAQWVHLMQQFQSDILPSEEMQLKQLITVDILISRGMVERKGNIEESDKLQEKIDEEYEKPLDVRDTAYLASMENQLGFMKTCITAYTTEYDKLLNQQKSISKDLKANRETRIKRIEDSKSSWVNTLLSLEDDDVREQMGHRAEIMRKAKDKALDDMSEYHTYVDGGVDQPFLTPETVKDEE